MTVDPFAAARPARLERLRGLIDRLQLDGILVQTQTTSRYLSGFAIRRGDESTSGYSGTLLVTADRAWLLADNRYVEQAAAEAPAWELVHTTELLPAEVGGRLTSAGVRRLGLESDRTSHASWLSLAAAAPDVELVAVEAELAELRLIKDATEVEAIGRACALGDEAFSYLCGAIRPGMTEKAVARMIATWFEDHGAEDLAFDSIVLVGARASMPHGTPDDTRVEAGQPLLLDFGCQVDGYRSDMTRTVFVGEPTDEARRRHEAVEAAQQAALDVVAIGAPRSAPHEAAQAFLADAGFPGAFRHGVGHGIGLDTHEAPALRTRATGTLEAGMVFSIEPGLYLPGDIGIRIEDIVALEASGPRLLTRAPREGVVIGQGAAA
ncbi:MAG TPA: Xaa-Pro peptidase family protein [Candidatus Limnocylindria bacterium]